MLHKREKLGRNYSKHHLLSDLGVHGVQSMGSGDPVSLSISFAYVTLADDDTHSILSDGDMIVKIVGEVMVVI